MQSIFIGFTEQIPGDAPPQIYVWHPLFNSRICPLLSRTNSTRVYALSAKWEIRCAYDALLLHLAQTYLSVVADRLFHSISRTWSGVNTATTDVKELIPEFYQVPETPRDDFFLNSLNLDLGVKQNGTRVEDVLVPPWAKDSADYHSACVTALESDYVDSNLNHWIDLIFGYKQSGPESIKADNVYEFKFKIDATADGVLGSTHLPTLVRSI